MPVEANNLVRLMHSDRNATLQKRRKMDPGMPPDKEEMNPEDLRDQLQG